jgi:hypothetical protein
MAGRERRWKRPHVLRDLASRFGRLVIDIWQEDLSLFVNEIVMAFGNMIP